LVHKQPLADQWTGQLTALLGLAKKEIGALSGTRKKLRGKVDVAMLQTLARMENLDMIVATYGQVIVDECHHVPAVSFEAVMKQCSTKYVLGLTATPDRKDGLEKLLYFQCGPAVHTMTTERAAHLVKRADIRETGFRIPEALGANPPYHIVAELLAADPFRNALIAADVATSLDAGRFPLVIADRKNQLGLLMELLRQRAPRCVPTVFSVDGGVSPKARRKLLVEMTGARRLGLPCVLFSTASLIGEGVDLPELDTLVLARPLSFEGRLIQYAGRLHRTAEGKTGVTVLDYVDSQWPVALSMYRNRLRAYRKMGYEVVEPEALLSSPSGLQRSLFS
jgi:superfamily II DNA or RNA helicase